MLEIKVTINAPELVNAIHALAQSMQGRSPSTETPAPKVDSIPVPEPAVPVAAAPTYTVEKIMAAGSTLMDAGKINDLMNLLHKFGVQAVMDLKPEQLGAFATEMRALGAAI
jgi:hypothetical protein